MTYVPPPAEELAILDSELRRLDARRAQLLARRSWLLAALRGAGPRPRLPGEGARRRPGVGRGLAAAAAGGMRAP
ncbi:hypothetical protein, partial [Streptomyces zhihengii]